MLLIFQIHISRIENRLIHYFAQNYNLKDTSNRTINIELAIQTAESKIGQIF